MVFHAFILRQFYPWERNAYIGLDSHTMYIASFCYLHELLYLIFYLFYIYYVLQIFAWDESTAAGKQ